MRAQGWKGRRLKIKNTKNWRNASLLMFGLVQRITEIFFVPVLRFCALGFLPATRLRFQFYFVSSLFSLFSVTSNFRLVFFKHVTGEFSALLYVTCLFVLFKNTILAVAFPGTSLLFLLEESYFWPTTVFTARHQNTRSYQSTSLYSSNYHCTSLTIW